MGWGKAGCGGWERIELRIKVSEGKNIILTMFFIEVVTNSLSLLKKPPFIYLPTKVLLKSTNCRPNELILV